MAWTEAARRAAAEARRKKAKLVDREVERVFKQTRSKVGLNISFDPSFNTYWWRGSGKGPGPRNTPLRQKLAESVKASRTFSKSTAKPRSAKYKALDRAVWQTGWDFEQAMKKTAKALGIRDQVLKYRTRVLTRYEKGKLKG